MRRVLAITLLAHCCAAAPPDAALYIDFTGTNQNLTLHHGLTTNTGRYGAALEFKKPLEVAEAPFTRKLDQARAATIGGWFLPRRSGEQYFIMRGVPETGQNGERFFKRQENWVNFLLGTDHRGFFLATINGNSFMPFPHVTLEEIPINSWSQLVVVKTEEGFQKFYRNGTLVHSDSNAVIALRIWPFNDSAAGEPLRLTMPLGGLIGEAWIVPRELSPAEVREDYLSKTNKYFPALPATPCSCAK